MFVTGTVPCVMTKLLSVQVGRSLESIKTTHINACHYINYGIVEKSSLIPKKVLIKLGKEAEKKSPRHLAFHYRDPSASLSSRCCIKSVFI